MSVFIGFRRGLLTIKGSSNVVGAGTGDQKCMLNMLRFRGSLAGLPYTNDECILFVSCVASDSLSCELARLCFALNVFLQ